MSSTPAADPTAADDPERPPLQISRGARIAAIAGIGALAGLTIAAGWESPVRAALVLVFLLFGPGLAIGELLQIRDPIAQLGLAAGISLGVETIVAVSLLYLGILSGELGFAIMYAITLAALAASVARAERGSLHAEAPPRRAST